MSERNVTSRDEAPTAVDAAGAGPVLHTSAPESASPGAPSPEAESPAPPSRTARASWNRTDLVISAAVGLAVATVAWIFRTELTPTDPWHYVMAALEFPQDSWVPLGYTRYGMILPLAPFVLAWGYAPATFIVPALLATAVMSGCTFLIATRWWGRVAGFIAVALLVSNWIVFVNLTRYYPDIPSIALVLLALVVAIVVRDRQQSRDLPSTGLLLLVGFLLGWSFETRETALFSWPIVLLVLWVSGRVVRNLLLVSAAVLFWAAVDIAIGAVAYGDPLLKVHTFTNQDLSATKLPGDLAVMNQFVGLPRVDYLTMIPRLALGSELPGAVWFLVLGAVALLGLLVRNKAVRASALALVASYVLFVGVSGFFLPDHPAGRLDVQRYWIQFVPWIALTVAGLCAVAVRAVTASARPRTRTVAQILVGLALVAGPVAAAVAAVPDSPGLAPNGGAPLRQISDALTRLPTTGARIYTDWETARVLPIYRRSFFGGDEAWSAPVRSISGKDKPVRGDYVLLVRTTSSPCFFCTEALKPWRERNSVPTNWEPVFTSERAGYVLYEVR